MGFYNGSLDGVIGPQTKQAVLEFQESNGLKRTATLDQQTADALIGNIGVGGAGSSMPPKSAGTGSMPFLRRERFRQPHAAKIGDLIGREPGSFLGDQPLHHPAHLHAGGVRGDVD